VSGARTDAVALTCAAAEAHARENDQAATFPVEALATMRRTRLLGLMVPADYGGGGGTLSELVDATIELGRADLSVALIFAMHCQQVAALARCASDRLRAHALPAVADGTIYLASVTTEPGKGGDLLISDSATEQVRAALRIDREAPIVTGGRHADAFLVTVRTPGATSPAQVDLVYAARDQLRLEVLGDWRPLGMRATESVPMRLAGTVPEWQVVGEHGEFRKIATTVFGPVAHIGWAAAWLGTAAGAYSRVVRHIRGPAGRSRFNPASQLLLTRLAATRARLEMVNALLRHTVSVVSSGEDVATPPVQLLINTLKTEAADSCFRAVDELVELTGLQGGYLAGSPLRLERAFRDLRSASLNYGNDRLRLANGSLALMDSGLRFA
jgi:acyl-CoA dehydrogenase